MRACTSPLGVNLLRIALAIISDNTNTDAATKAPFFAYAPTLVCSKYSLSALSYSIRDAARHPSQGDCGASSAAQENTNKGTMVAPSQGFKLAVLVLWSILTARDH